MAIVSSVVNRPTTIASTEALPHIFADYLLFMEGKKEC